MEKAVIIGVAVAVVVIVVVIWATRGWRKRRLEALRRVAAMLGLAFEGRSNTFVIPDAKKFKLLRRAGTVDELMRGQRHGRTVAVFRYTVVVHYGHGATASIWRVAAFQTGEPLPVFQMRPQSWSTRLKHRLAHRDIVFDTHPEVMRRFYVTAPKQDAVRALFDGQVLSQLTAVPASKFTVEASGRWLLVYCRTRWILKTETIPQFLEQADALARIFVEHHRSQRVVTPASAMPMRMR